MEADRRNNPKSKAADGAATAAEDVKIIQWEDFEHELVRFCSLKSALAEAEEKKRVLVEKLEARIQVKTESLSQLNQLEEMREKLEAKRLAHRKLSMEVKAAKEDVMKQEEGLGAELTSLLVAGSALSVARKGLEESRRKLVEEEGYADLRSLQRKVKMRHQQMISEVSFLYRVRVLMGPTKDQELESFASINRIGGPVEYKQPSHGVLTISGLQLSILPFKKLTFFTDKKEVQRTATALGYVAHAVLLVASYLKVHLRYPIRFGGSRSYIMDPAPSIDSSAFVVVPSNSSSLSNLRTVEFPLFLQGQDTTRAAYAVFLLNKDLEQLLNFIGVRSLGPRHVLGNLKELYRTIISPEYLDS